MPKKPRPFGDRAVRDVLAAKADLSERHFRSVAHDRNTAGPGAAPRRVWGPARRVPDLIDRALVHIHAIGVGRKVVANKVTKSLSVRVYVTQKLPKTLLPAAARVPETLEGVPTDVIESPPAFLAASALPPPCSIRRTRPQRPLRGGISAANESVNAGTLTALCHSTRPADAGRRFILGNNHTFADLGVAPLGSPILQPSPRDGGTANDQIATLARFVPIDETDTAANLVDAALAELIPGALMQSDICTLGAPQGTSQPELDASVQKHGRTTGFTTGIIDDPSIDFLIPLSRTNPDRVSRFIRQIRIRPSPDMAVFAQGGDSGALVTTRADNRAIGLLFACPDDGSFAYANPIAEVMTALEITFA